MLGRGPEDAPERHRTLRATLDWSFELLAPAERDAFTALAAFAGGCELDAAEAVTRAPLSVLEDLVDKGLVTASGGRLGCSNQSASTRPSGSPRDPTPMPSRERHLRHYADLARERPAAADPRSQAVCRGVRADATGAGEHPRRDRMGARKRPGDRCADPRRILAPTSGAPRRTPSSARWPDGRSPTRGLQPRRCCGRTPCSCSRTAAPTTPSGCQARKPRSSSSVPHATTVDRSFPDRCERSHQQPGDYAVSAGDRGGARSSALEHSATTS